MSKKPNPANPTPKPTTEIAFILDRSGSMQSIRDDTIGGFDAFMAGMLGLSETDVRVIAPFVGGGFGPKIMLAQPEEVLLCWATRRLGRPIKWIEDRAENFVCTTQERSQLHDVEIALTRDGKIVGLQDVFLHDTGAYDPYALTVPLNMQRHIMGPYNISRRR